jgi:hypothetical protein
MCMYFNKTKSFYGLERKSFYDLPYLGAPFLERLERTSDALEARNRMVRS